MEKIKHCLLSQRLAATVLSSLSSLTQLFTTLYSNHRQPKVAYNDKMWRKLTPVECERLQTLEDGYTAEGVDDRGITIKISNTRRYQVLGNGWTVDVIAHLFKFLKHAMGS